MTIPPRSFVFSSGVPHERDDQGDRSQLADLAAGKPQALAALYDQHAASLFRHALALTRHRSDAEDLVQAVFVKLATTGAELLGVQKPASYLHRMLHTTWVDGRRRAITGERVVQHVAPDASVPPVDVAGSIDVARALDELPEAQREAIVLHVVEGFSFREVGRQTGVSLFTAAARYRLAVTRLRRSLAHPPGENR